MSGRRSWVRLGALTVAVVVVSLVTYLLVRPDPYVAPRPVVSAARPDATGAARALRGLIDAVSNGDAGAASSLAPGTDTTAGALLSAVVSNAEALRVSGFTARYVDAIGGLGEDGRWQAAVDLTWRFDGFDQSAAHEEVLVGFEAASGDDGGDVTITGFGGGELRTPLWLTGPLEVRRSADSLVLAAGTAADADLVAERADAAVPVVRSVLSDWPGRLVVEVPASEAGLDASLGADPGTYTNIAAVSTTVDGSLEPDSELHVFVNPDVYDGLEPVGGQVVMSHEATHIATKAPLAGGVPLWLLEGFADFVALHDVELPVQTTASQVIAQVRADGLPDQLPADTDFDETATHLGASYESAWVACLVLASTVGEDALVRLYQRVSRTRDVGAALRRAGTTEEQLTSNWRDRLRALAASSTSGGA